VVKSLQLVPERRPFFDQQVRALEEQGVECTVVTVPGEYSPASPRSVQDYLRFYPRVLRSISGEYDVVHANYGLMGPFAMSQPHRPVVLTLWGTDLMSERSWLTGVSRWSAKFADETILPSHAMASALRGEYTYLPFGVDTDRFRPIPQDQARERVGWDADETVVLFPYDPTRREKDYPRAERVVERADVDATLVPLSDVPYDEMPHYMNASDAVLVTSTRESGPMVAKEAAACGVPVVSTDVGFVSSVPGARVHTTDDGLAAALTEAVSAFADGAGRPEAVDDEYDLERMGERLVSLYERHVDAEVSAWS
jgi:glycosyltransferase involved in cell wall biosynthesis